EVVEPDRVMRSGDYGRHRGLMLRAETVDEQRLKISQRYSAIDRAAGGEGDNESVGAAGEALGSLGCILDPAHPRLQGCNAGAVGGRRGRGRWTIYLGTWNDGLKGGDNLRLG